jgi:hypothetical protein
VTRLGLSLAGAVVFAALATANAGGYRYGIADQAYYTAAQEKSADPRLFPRDSSLLEAQSRLMIVDDVIGWTVRTTGISLPALSFALYLVGLAALYVAATAFARALGASPWATSALLLLLTLRHRIPKTGANTLEGYMHPRMLAFALGVAALACVLRRRFGWSVVCIGACAIAHTTTAFWFGIATATAAFVHAPAWRRGLSAVAVAVALGGSWALSVGPLADRLVIMDEPWLDVLRAKDYLFAAEWPVYAWLLNFGYLAILIAVFRRRQIRRTTAPGESGLGAGLLTLIALFIVSVPIASAHVALALQLQVNRVFWIADFLAAAAVAWWLADDLASTIGRRGRIVLVAVLATVSLGRGVYVTALEAGRPIVEIGLPDTAWNRAMAWLRDQPIDWHVLADPGHAWKFGSSVRVSAGRDVLLEWEKDSALAMYDRGVAMRVAERSTAIADFERITSDDVRRLAARFDLDVFVAELDRPFDFPRLFQNERFAVYALK